MQVVSDGGRNKQRAAGTAGVRARGGRRDSPALTHPVPARFGVTAGIHLAYAFITAVWGAEDAEWAQGLTEFVPRGQCDDPFSARFNVSAEYHLDGCS